MKRIRLGALLLPVLLFLGHLDLAAQCGTFSDGFESGTIGPQWQFGTGSYTRTVPNTNSAVGTYHVAQSSTTTNSFYQGMYSIFTPSQPTQVSFWMRTNNTSIANGYVVMGNSSISSDNGILFCYFNATSQLRFFGTTGYNYSITANTWYHVEARNINWTARTMDIWVNKVQILTAWPFRSPSATTIDRVHLFNLTSGTVTAEYDEFQIGAGGPVISSGIVTDPLCFGDSTGAVDITATSANGGLTYAWSNGTTLQDLSFVPAAMYHVTVTDQLGCSTQDSFAVAAPPQLLTSGIASDVVCYGQGNGAIDLSVAGGTPGYQYAWNTGATTQDLTALTPGMFNVVVTDTNGCTVADSFTVQEPLPITGNYVATSPTCRDGNDGAIDFSPSGGVGGYSFVWSSGDTVEDLSAVSAGFYSVVVNDSLGCTFQDTIELLNPAPILANGSSTSPTCFSYGNGSISINPTGGTPVYTFLWSNGATTQNLISTPAGTFSVSITDANGCIGRDTFLVTQPTAISTSGAVTNASGTNNGAINLTVTGGTPPYTYLWSNNGTTQDLSGLPGNMSYSVIIHDANGCEALDTFFVDEVIAVSPALASTVRVWPNPFHDRISVDLHAQGVDGVRLAITDAMGRELWREDHAQTGTVSIPLSVSNGVYLLRMEQSGTVQYWKLLKQ